MTSTFPSFIFQLIIIAVLFYIIIKGRYSISKDLQHIQIVVNQGFYLILKRALDILLALAGLLILLPLLTLISLIIYVSSGFPVFYLQERIGRNWIPFRIIKFRTMVNDAGNSGKDISTSDDSRITKPGKILRKYKLDELPQLINVVKGDMSIVGPRPEIPRFAKHYQNEYTEILKIKPGISDYAALVYRNEAALIELNNAEEKYIHNILPHKIILYKKYINEMSLLTDLKIIISTIKGVFL